MVSSFVIMIKLKLKYIVFIRYLRSSLLWNQVERYISSIDFNVQVLVLYRKESTIDVEKA